jgi:hypothetical protein
VRTVRRDHRRRWSARRSVPLLAVAALVVGLVPTAAAAQTPNRPTTDDPRVGLGAGLFDAEEASLNLELSSTQPKPDGFFNPANLGSLSFANSDLAFKGDLAFAGNFHGFTVYDVSDPTEPVLRTSVICPGGQGDLSVHGDLLFMSVEETRGRVDCGTEGNAGGAQESRFRGVRIFDISDVDEPVQLPGLQACKGSHTHTLVTDPDDPDNVYIYISGTAGIRNAAEAPGGCTGASSLVNPDTDNFSIAIYRVPVEDPAGAELVNRNARVMSTCGDNSCQDQHADGALNGLPGSGRQPTYPEDSPRAPGGQSRSQTSQCHDITAYPEIGLAAGACQGHGILLDISDPANPRRIDAVEDFNFAYWHSATFNNDGTKVIFTDEWGGGTGARCRATDPLNWGANALFDLVETADGLKMEFASYFKLPMVQTNQENCVAHNGSLIPVPGRDIMVQAWYQGGTTVFDFTDSANPVEIAYFDRGPISPTSLVTGGYWSSYWFNGAIYGTEIARGFDSLALLTSEHLSENELAVARSVSNDELNPQAQVSYSFAPSFTLVRAYRDQAERADIDGELLAQIDKFVDRAEQFQSGPQARAARAQLGALANQLDEVGGYDLLSGSLRDLQASLG